MKMIPRRLLAVDPGEKAGWCFFETGRYKESGSCSGDIQNFKTIKTIIKNFMPLNKILIEDQHIKGRTKGIKTLIERRCIWQMIGMSYDIDVSLMNASWKQFWGLEYDRTIENKCQRRKEFKNRVTRFASNLINNGIENDNEADAVLMGLCWINRIVLI